jgi:hypothetical protein
MPFGLSRRLVSSFPSDRATVHGARGAGRSRVPPHSLTAFDRFGFHVPIPPDPDSRRLDQFRRSLDAS